MHERWFRLPDPVKKGAHIAIIGGGISGVTLKQHIVNAGYNVTLIDKESQILSAASGNPAAIIDPFVSIGDGNEKNFHLIAYRYALQFYRSLGPDIFKPTSLIKLPKNSQEEKRFNKIAEHYNKEILYFDDGRLIFPNSGLVIPKEIAQHDSCADHRLQNVKINRIDRTNEDKWSLFCDENTHILDVDVVILASAYGINEFLQSSHLELEKTAGQISYIRSSETINNIYCSEGYLTPTVNSPIGKVNIIGATFEKNSSLEISDQAHNDNLEKAPNDLDQVEVIGGRRGIRAMSKDHLPIAGPLPVYDDYLTDYADIRHGPKHKEFPEPSYHKNLYISAGLGARGFVTAPLLAKYITAIINGNEKPFSDAISNALHPARFIIRNLSKK